VQADELRAFHIPMGLLRLQTQVNHVSELLVQQLNHRGASLRRKVVPGFVKFCFYEAHICNGKVLAH